MKIFRYSKKNIASDKGFTLLELIVVIAILGIISAIAIPNFLGYIDKVNYSVDVSNAKMMYDAYVAAEAGGTELILTGGVSPIKYHENRNYVTPNLLQKGDIVKEALGEVPECKTKYFRERFHVQVNDINNSSGKAHIIIKVYKKGNTEPYQIYPDPPTLDDFIQGTNLK
ncbi:MAG: hypothetical protein CSB16_02420 [Clostridiales bacterium]|nr:MAG: hypothetical protein CSB16_02420 [Clostridiales bacterium]